MAVVAWTERPEGEFDPELHLSPAVLLGCTHGVCAKVNVVKPKRLDRKVPDGLTSDQFHALKAGSYWTEIVNG